MSRRDGLNRPWYGAAVPRKVHPINRWIRYLITILLRAVKHRAHGSVTIVLHGGEVRSVRFENTVVDPDAELGQLRPSAEEKADVDEVVRKLPKSA